MCRINRAKPVRRRPYKRWADSPGSTSIEDHRNRNIQSKANFTLHKWHSNTPELQTTENRLATDEEPTFTKQQLGHTLAVSLDLHGTRMQIELELTYRQKDPHQPREECLAKWRGFMIPLG